MPAFCRFRFATPILMRKQLADLIAAALACLQVFALGERAGGAAESSYFVVRGMLAKSLTEAARFIAERGMVAEGAPVVVRFMTQVASRFGLVVTLYAIVWTMGMWLAPTYIDVPTPALTAGAMALFATKLLKTLFLYPPKVKSGVRGAVFA